MLAGWRLLHDNGDPVEVIDAETDRLTSLGASDDAFVFWRQLREVCQAGNRGRALSWLDEQRRTWLTDLGVPAEAIAPL